MITTKAVISRIVRLWPGEILNGYENPELIEAVFRKTAVYSPSDPWLEAVGRATILDFGGGCGALYKRALLANPDIRFAVVETPKMSARAAELSTPQLGFFSTVEAAKKWLGQIDLVHSDGALQYTRDPILTLRELCSISADEMLWHRVFLSERGDMQISWLAHNGPGISISRKRVAYSRTAISRDAFMAGHAGYRLAKESADTFRFSKTPRRG